MTHSSDQRWYDQNEHLAAAIGLTLDMPDEILTIISQGIILLAEKEFKVEELLKNFKSLGTKKVLAIYRSKEKNRNYDKNPTAHKMVNYLYLMSPENQIFMAKHIIQIMKHVQEYLKLCSTHQIDPQKEDLENITQNYVSQGNEAVEKTLKLISQTFLKSVEDRASGIQGPQSVIREDHQDRQNMRVTSSH